MAPARINAGADHRYHAIIYLFPLSSLHDFPSSIHLSSGFWFRTWEGETESEGIHRPVEWLDLRDYLSPEKERKKTNRASHYGPGSNPTSIACRNSATTAGMGVKGVYGFPPHPVELSNCIWTAKDWPTLYVNVQYYGQHKDIGNLRKEKIWHNKLM
jgi:hypothetical protein